MNINLVCPEITVNYNIHVKLTKKCDSIIYMITIKIFVELTRGEGVGLIGVDGFDVELLGLTQMCVLALVVSYGGLC